MNAIPSTMGNRPLRTAKASRSVDRVGKHRRKARILTVMGAKCGLRIGAAVLAICAVSSAPPAIAQGEQRIRIDSATEYEIPPFAENKSRIDKNGSEYMLLDFGPFSMGGVNEFRRFNERIGSEQFPPSPDGRYLPVILSSENSFQIITIDLMQKKIVQFKPAKPFYIYKVSGLTWITNKKLIIRAPMDDFLYNVSEPQLSRPLYNEYAVAWNAQKTDYASVYGKIGYDIHGARNASPEEISLFDPISRMLLFSEAIKYDSRFVYPPDLQELRDDYDYPDWDTTSRTERLAGRDIVVDFKRNPPKVRRQGALLDQRHTFSAPVFIANTEWIACLEQVYAPESLETHESNILLLDAHSADSIPPRSGSVKIMKVPVDPLIPRNELEYKDMTLHLNTIWNASKSAIEIWQGDRGTNAILFGTVLVVAGDESKRPRSAPK